MLSLLALFLAGSAPGAQEITPPGGRQDGSKLEMRVSVLLIDVVKVLDSEQAIEADLAYRLEWRDERLAAGIEEERWFGEEEIWTPRFEPLTPRSVRRLLPDLVIVDPEGNCSLTQRLAGTFGAKTYLADFPFDEHTISFPFAFFLTGAHLELEVVQGPIVELSESLSIPDWSITDPRLSVAPIVVSRYLPPAPGATFSVTAKRNTAHYVRSVIFTLIVIVMMSWTVFWAPPAQIAVQFGFAATSILTVIAYRFALASQIPPVPYTTRLDSFMNGSFVLAFLALVEVIVTAQLIYRERVAAAERIDRHCRWMFPVALVAMGVYAFLI